MHSGYTFVLSVCVFPGNRTHNLCTAKANALTTEHQEHLPIQTASIFLLSDVGESLPATQVLLARQSYIFHPTAGETYPSRQRVFSSCRRELPGHPTLPFRLHLSDTESLDLPSDTGEVLPARQPYLFNPLARRGLPVRHSDY